MTLVFGLIAVTAMLMMLQNLISRVPKDTNLGDREQDKEQPPEDGGLNLTHLRVLTQLLVTVVGLVGGGYVVLYGDFPVDVRYWAAGLVGAVFGFWLR